MAYIQIKYGVRFQNGFHEFRQLGGIKIFHHAQNRWNCAAMWDSTGPSGKGVAKTWTWRVPHSNSYSSTPEAGVLEKKKLQPTIPYFTVHMLGRHAGLIQNSLNWWQSFKNLTVRISVDTMHCSHLSLDPKNLPPTQHRLQFSLKFFCLLLTNPPEPCQLSGKPTQWFSAYNWFMDAGSATLYSILLPTNTMDGLSSQTKLNQKLWGSICFYKSMQNVLQLWYFELLVILLFLSETSRLSNL